jgi:hypothetical protein
MELWIGEVKFYKDISAAIRDVVAEIEDHTRSDYLRDEFLWIKGKIDDSSGHAAQLRKLLSPNTSLDVVFKRACIPVLLTYESDCVAGHNESSAEYCDAFESESRLHRAKFLEKLSEIALPDGLVIRLFLLPIHIKEALIEALDDNLKTWQDR